jgi:hypothetical protein
VKVWSVPMGTGKEGSGRDASALVDARTPSPSSCCTPERYAGPSGVRLRHASGCRAHGRVYEGPIGRGDRFGRRHAIETRRVGLDDAVPMEGAGGVLTSVGSSCPVHPDEPALDCLACSERRI